MAEESYPGIGDVYAALDEKPATFLQLVWIYEELCQSLEAAGELDLILGSPRN
jgi:hypothetical protein